MIKTLAFNTFKEAARSKVLFGLLFFGFFLLLISSALAGLSFSEKERLLIQFGLAAIQVSLVVLTIFLGNGLIFNEIANKTVLSILSKPISRSKFLLGKLLGLDLVLSLLFLGFCFLFSLLLYLNGTQISKDVLVAYWGIFIEVQVLLSIAVFLSTFTTPFFNACFSSGIFLIGHWQDSLAYFAQRGESIFLKPLHLVVSYLLPNLETWNWKVYATSYNSLLWNDFWTAHIYAIGWVGLFIVVAIFIFKRTDCV